MSFADIYATPDDFGPPRDIDVHESLGASLGGQALESLDPQSGVSAFQLWRRARAAYAGGEALPGLNMPDTPSAQDLAVNQQVRDEIPDVPIADAKARVKQEGLEGLLPLPDQPSIKQPVLDLMIDEAHEHRNRQVAIDRGPHGFAAGALGFATSIGAGMIDPVNIAAFSIPVLGEARWGQMLAGAGDSLVARAGARAVQGAAQGAVGTAALQPAEWLLHTADGRDYTMAEALRSVALGAGMGAAFHAGLGGIGDLRARAKGLPLPGSTEETLTRALQPQSETQLEAPGGALRSPDEARSVAGANSEAAGAPPEPAATPEALPPGHPAHVLADLPEMAREDVHRAATADVIAGRPVRVGEMLQEAAKTDPRIAETIDAFHGSPHDFEAFDASRIGTGEGAQSYGHGLYFAENSSVAGNYATNLSKPPEGPIPANVVAALRSLDNLGFSRPGEALTAIRQERLDWTKRWDVDPARSPEEAAAIATINKHLADVPRGTLYQARINRSRDHFIDWDKPVSEQSPYVKAVAEKFFPGGRTSWGYELKTGEDLVRALSSEMRGDRPVTRDPIAASHALHEAGIAGVKYLDQFSRADAVGGRIDAAGLRAKIQNREALIESTEGLIRQSPNEEQRARLAQRVEDLRAEIADIHGQIAKAEKAAAGGTRNFVLFSDKDVEITHKNGEPVQRNTAAMPQAVPTDAEIARDLGRGSTKPEKQQSLLQFLRARGGLKPHGDIDAVFGGKKLDLLRKDGMSLDRAREAAVEAGYLHDPGRDSGRPSESTTRDLLDAMDAENRGNKVYPAGSDVKGRDHDLERLEGELTAGFHELGQNWSDVPKRTRDRALHIMYTEGVEDPVAAYERAVLEEDYYAEKSGRIRRIAGNELPAEQRAAQAAGAGDQAGRGTGEPGGPARQSGVNDRSPDWQQFAEQRPEYDEPQLVAESNEAARAPEPASIEPERAVTAAEKAAADARELLADMKPHLSDEEWRSLEDALATVDQEKGVGEQIVRDGAACLAAAVA